MLVAKVKDPMEGSKIDDAQPEVYNAIQNLMARKARGTERDRLLSGASDSVRQRRISEPMMQSDQVPIFEQTLQALAGFPIEIQRVYPRSLCSKNGLTYGLVRTLEGKKLVVLGEREGVFADPFRGRVLRQILTLKVCDLSAENTEILMSLFPFTRPKPLLRDSITIGTGDRLGVATPGHIRGVRRFPVRPILAQQSVRENRQTGRSFKEVVRDAAWGVFEENFQKGFGADGDHLKSIEEVKVALDAGVSMITLDVSEKLDPEAFLDSRESIEGKFRQRIDEEEAKVLSHYFLEKEFLLNGPQGECRIKYDTEQLKRNALCYHQAIEFAEEVFEFIRSEKEYRRVIDFEISIDETPFPTTPENHLFFIIGLNHRGVVIDSLAPRFVGEFQKGIDYRGDRNAFRRHFDQHCLIAEHYGNYKISVHSGSDKFSVFPEVGKSSKNSFHVKTAGTSWLEAMRLVASVAPPLYREMHAYSLSVFDEASKLYLVSTDLDRVPKLERVPDQDLPVFLGIDDSRQLLHITYGYLLNAKGEDGKNLFRDRFYRILTQYEEDYASLLEQHIGKHLAYLGVERDHLNTGSEGH
jgi:tagaturonate epimerase